MIKLRRIVFALTFFAAGILIGGVHRPTVDREGYFRDRSLLDLFAPPVETAYRASILKSFQTGTITILNGSATQTGTITSVDTTNSFVAFGGNTFSFATSGESAGSALAYLEVTNATTLTATRGFTGDGADDAVPYVVMEYWPRVLNSAVQRGTIAMAAGDTTKDATITSVGTTKTWVVQSGWTPTDSNAWAGATHNKLFVHLTLNSATAVRLTRSASGTFTPKAPYQVLEYRG